MPTSTSPLAQLGAFRSQLHACFFRRADALFELGDALLCAQAVSSLPHLSLEPVHQRGWGSSYAALACGQIDAERLRDLLAGWLPPADPLVFAVDVTTWPRCDAECSPERGYYYHPSRHSAGQPIIAGWAYQWIAQLGFDRDSWTAPVDALRLHPLEDTDQTAAAQIRALLGRLPAGGPVPWFVFDAGYDSAQLSLDLADAPAAVLVRLRSDRCFYADPPPRPPGAGGRPRRHGAKFAFADPATWPAPTTTLHTSDDQDGTVTVHAWAGLHPSSTATRPRQRPATADRARHHPARPGPAGPGPDPAAKVLWLWWAGPGQPDLDLGWRAYTRRFDLEHTLRFCKQTLGWVTPRVRHPEQPSGGPGWCWPATPSCAWPASSPATSGWRGSGPARPASCRPTGSAGGFRACCAWRGRRPPRRNPPGAPLVAQGPPIRPRPAPPCSQEAHQETQEEAAHHQDGLSGPTRRHAHQPPPTGPAADHRVKTQAKSLISLLGGPFRAENGAGCPLTSLLFGR